MQQRVHVLGAGAVGLLWAFYLRSNGFPVTLLLRDAAKLQLFRDAGNAVQLTSAAAGETRTQPLDAEAVDDDASSSSSSSTGFNGAASPPPIEALVVATKAHQAVPALQSVRSRLRATSTVLLLQNGLIGLYDEIRERVFPPDGGEKAPSVVVASVTHGCYRRAPFHVVHAGWGACAAAAVDPAWPSLLAPATLTEARHEVEADAGHASALLPGEALLQELARGVPELRLTRFVSRRALAQDLCLKLGANCCINPLTALLQCRNGALLREPHMRELMRGIAAEVAAVFRPNLPDLRPDDYYDRVVAVASATTENRSSMLQDITSGGGQTEIDYMNGYVAAQAARLGLHAPHNLTLAQLIRAKTDMRLESLSLVS